MDKEEKFDKKGIGFIVGGAVLGAIAGYLVKKVGVKNIITVLKAKDIIPHNIANLISEFTSKKFSEEE
jgi:hypothetical protein